MELRPEHSRTGVAHPASHAAVFPATPGDVVDDAVTTLRAHAERWLACDLEDRLALLERTRRSTWEAAPAWVAAMRRAKRTPEVGAASAEEWFLGIVPVLRQLRLLERSLRQTVATGRPQPPRIALRAGGNVVVDLLPADRFDRVILRDHRAQARIRVGVGLDEVEQRIGRAGPVGQRRRGEVGVVLGAGNVSSVPALDVLHQLFVADRVVLLKPSPVVPEFGVHLGEAFAPLIEAGVLRIVHGDDDLGRALATRDDIDAIHVTGTRRTLAEVRDIAAPAVTVTGEADGVTPVIVVPGPWTNREVETHARVIAGTVTSNAGFTCVAPRVLVQHRTWARRGRLGDAIAASLARAQPRYPFLPGAVKRFADAVAERGRVQQFGDAGEDLLGHALIRDLDPDVGDTSMFGEDPFCGVVGEVGLDAPRSVPEFVAAAVEFCNERLAGRVAATILVHPRSLLDAAVALAVDTAIDDLAYGSVTVNTMPALAYGLGCAPWGSAPEPGVEPGAGRDAFVHNTYMLPDVAKTVVRGPFRPHVTPPWSHEHRTADRLGPRMARLIATGDPRWLPGVVTAAARG